MRIAVIGAGSWGTAVSALLGSKGTDVQLWAREPEIAEGINAMRQNPLYLTDVVLPGCVVATPDIEEALRGAEAVVIVTPSHGVRGTAESMKPFLADSMPIVNLSKGVERGTDMRMTEVLEDVLGNRARLAALSGPNHAEEVSKQVPSATVVAAYDEAVGRMFQDAFMAPTFRVYTNPDVVGVELCAACKNVVAVAAGMSDGLGYGDNTKATLMTRGLAEMARLGARLGANPLTFMGLAGVGDLIATCTSRHSRNRGLGEHVALGGSVDSYAAETHMVAEGAYSCVSVDELGHREGMELPITHQVRSILYDGASPTTAGALLMGRAAKDELHGMGLIVDEEV
ncbi:MAG: NAD(P)-dependent glycerol-3-phosphate dehydrogenase [Actinobacteria bacterium HGW-Actinobacteria-1]|jgi:glycerol-3-phosphate dehydrogenase (NAD(P)+)|nr:MAG: NAD(P)-dependent glycerol-3-phosphate dehydrogenase [Actinobacteria bacterium HGW-Actinobacteria-1]